MIMIFTYFTQVNDAHFSLTLSLQMHVSWVDSRIMNVDNETNTDNMVHVRMNDRMSEYLWKPRMEMVSLKNINELKGVLKETNDLMYIDPGPTRWVTIYKMIQPEITCKMDFSHYPFDHHTCYFIALVYDGFIKTTFTGAEVGYYLSKYQNTVLEYDFTFSDLPMTSMSFSGPDTPEELQKQAKMFGWENLSVAGFTMDLKRRWTSYYLIYYLPSSLFVVTSWSSFLISPKTNNDRMSLMITLFLAMTTLLAGTIISSPAVSTGLTALLIWIIVHFFFILAAIAAYTFLLALERFTKRQFWRTGADMEKMKRDAYKKIDLVFLGVFPSVYLCFNVVYWVYYLSEH